MAPGNHLTTEGTVELIQRYPKTTHARGQRPTNVVINMEELPLVAYPIGIQMGTPVFQHGIFGQ
jgi:hypothetical protein